MQNEQILDPSLLPCISPKNEPNISPLSTPESFSIDEPKYDSLNSPNTPHEKEDHQNLLSSSKEKLLTLHRIKEKIRKLDSICKSENYDENIINGFDINQKFTPTKTPTPLKLKKVTLLVTESSQTDQNEGAFFSDDQLELFQDIQEENEVLKKENEDLSKIISDLQNSNNQYLKQLEDSKAIKHEYSKLLEKFGSESNSQSIINIYDENQKKLDKINELLSISDQADPHFEICNLVQERKENIKIIKNAKVMQNFLIGKYETLVYEYAKLKKDFHDYILKNNQSKQQQLNFNNNLIFAFLVIILPVFLYNFILFSFF